MYNRKEIKVRSTAKPKKDAFRNDMIYSKDGLFNPFTEGQVRVPSNVITTQGMPGNVLAKVSDGRQVMMQPNQIYDFCPNVNYVDEEAKFNLGGGVQYMDVALSDDQIEEYKNGGYYIEDLPKAQDGRNVRYTDDPNDPGIKAYNDSSYSWNRGSQLLLSDPNISNASEQVADGIFHPLDPLGPGSPSI